VSSDARKVGHPDHSRRVQPRNSAIWVRIDGRWRRGHIRVWARTPEGWVIWTQYTTDSPWTLWEWIAYDPASIRERHDESPPAD